MKKSLSVAGFAVVLLSGCNFGPPLTPLIGAARDGDADRIKSLVRDGADPNQRGGVNDWTPLMHAVHKNRIASVRALLDAGADPNARFGDGETTLMMAAGYGQADIAKELLARGADPRARDAHGVTAIDLAVGGVPDIDDFTVGTCHDGVVQALLAAAPDLRLSGGVKGKLARLAAHAGGCADVLRMLDRARTASAAAR